MRLKTMKQFEEALIKMEIEIEEKINNIEWDKSEGESWRDKCQQKEEYFDDVSNEIFEIGEIIQRIKDSNLIDF